MKNRDCFFLLVTILLFASSSLFASTISNWEKTEYIWNFGIISNCDKGMKKRPVDYFQSKPHFNKTWYQNIERGDLVWVKCCFLPQFCQEVLPEVENPFVLVISDGDESFPKESGLDSKAIEQLIWHEKIVHIFAQNCDCEPNDKITHLPIGIDYHTIAYKGSQGGWGEKGSPLKQEELLKRFLRTFLPANLRKKMAFVDFQHADTLRGGDCKRYLQCGEDRAAIFLQLLKTGLIDYSSWMPRSSLWMKKGEYAFSISPHGNGLDCHRTWEDLLLGCIVIVKTSSLDKMYEGLPVVIVDSWDEITEENLSRWLHQYGDTLANPFYREKLTLDYWMGKLREKSFNCRNI